MWDTALSLIQTAIAGVLTGGLYTIISLALSLGWGVLRVINLAHFGLVVLAAYMTYQLTQFGNWNPFVTVLATFPIFLLVGMGLQYFFLRFRIETTPSLLVTFGLFLILENVMKMIWTADFRRISFAKNPYFVSSISVGPLVLPLLLLLVFVVAVVLAVAFHLLFKKTHVGRALRAITQDPAVATAFGVDYERLALAFGGLATATAAVAGVFVGMIYALYPSAAEPWIGISFAVTIMGGLGNPLGALGAGVIIGLVEAMTQRVADPSVARLVSLVLLAIVLLVRPSGLFRPLVPEQ